MNAFEATLLAYYTLRLPSCPGYEKAAQFEGLMCFDNHIASIRVRAARSEGYLDALDLFNITWTLGIIDWRRRSGYATSPELGEKIIAFLESLPIVWGEDARAFTYVVSSLYQLTLDFEMLRVLPSVLDLRLEHLERAIKEIMRREALDSNVYRPTAELKRQLKIARKKLS